MFCFFQIFAKSTEVFFSPPPKVMVLDSVTDVYDWMLNQTPQLHDNLKAHQFKFQCNESGVCHVL